MCSRLGVGLLLVVLFSSTQVLGASRSEICFRALSGPLRVVCAFGICLSTTLFSNLKTYAQDQDSAQTAPVDTSAENSESQLSAAAQVLGISFDDITRAEVIRRQIQRLHQKESLEKSAAAFTNLSEMMRDPQLGQVLMEEVPRSDAFVNARTVVLKALSRFRSENPLPTPLENNSIRRVHQLMTTGPVDLNKIRPELFLLAIEEDGYRVLEVAAELSIEKGRFRTAADFLRNAIVIVPERNRGSKSYEIQIRRLWNRLGFVLMLQRDRYSLQFLVGAAEKKKEEFPALYTGIQVQEWKAFLETPVVPSAIARSSLIWDTYGLEYVTRRLESLDLEVTTGSSLAMDEDILAELRDTEFGPGVVAVVQKMFQSRNEFILNRAMTLAEAYDARFFLRDLFAIFTLPNPSLHSRASEILSNIPRGAPSETETAFLIEHIRGENQASAVAALVYLGVLGKDASGFYETLLDVARNGENPYVRQRAISAIPLVMRGTGRGVFASLIAMMDLPTVEIGWHAYEALGNVEVVSEDLPALLKTVKSQHESLRVAAFKALGRLINQTDHRPLASLILGLNDPNPVVWTNVLETLNNIALTEADHSLLREVAKTEGRMRDWAEQFLRKASSTPAPVPVTPRNDD